MKRLLLLMLTAMLVISGCGAKTAENTPGEGNTDSETTQNTALEDTAQTEKTEEKKDDGGFSFFGGDKGKAKTTMLEDGTVVYEPMQEIIDEPFYSLAIQLHDQVYHFPMSMDEFITKLEKSEVKYEYEYNPDAVVDVYQMTEDGGGVRGYRWPNSYQEGEFTFSYGNIKYTVIGIPVSDRLGDVVVVSIETYEVDRASRYRAGTILGHCVVNNYTEMKTFYNSLENNELEWITREEREGLNFFTNSNEFSKWSHFSHTINQINDGKNIVALSVNPPSSSGMQLKTWDNSIISWKKYKDYYLGYAMQIDYIIDKNSGEVINVEKGDRPFRAGEYYVLMTKDYIKSVESENKGLIYPISYMEALSE